MKRGSVVLVSELSSPAVFELIVLEHKERDEVGVLKIETERILRE